MPSSRGPLVYAVMIGAVVLLAVALIWVSWRPGSGAAEVTGIVTVNGKPIEGLEVTFMPDPAKGGSGPVTSVHTDAQGRFRIGAGESGAAGSGFYRVVIKDPTTSLPPGAELFDAPDPDPTAKGKRGAKSPRPKQLTAKSVPPRIPRQYGDISGTPLVDIELKPGTQELNFELAAGKKPLH